MSYGGASGGSGRIATSSDVALSNPADGQVLAYDTATAKWKNAVVTGGSGAVSSVAGRTGAVVLAESDITNLSTDLASKAQATNGGMEAAVIANSGSSYAINLANANLFSLTLTANCTFTLSGATAGKSCSVTVMLKQDGTGSRTVTWPSSVKWSGGTAPTLTATANKVDFVSILSVDGGTTWYGFISGLNY